MMLACLLAPCELPARPAGIQPQTAECIVIGEITTRDLIVVLNKTGVRECKCDSAVRTEGPLVLSVYAACCLASSGHYLVPTVR